MSTVRTLGLGIVTPSNSLEGSNDEPKTLQAMETTKKFKWRQRGNPH
jgi:hypothetical protein